MHANCLVFVVSRNFKHPTHKVKTKNKMKRSFWPNYCLYIYVCIGFQITTTFCDNFFLGGDESGGGGEKQFELSNPTVAEHNSI